MKKPARGGLRRRASFLALLHALNRRYVPLAILWPEIKHILAAFPLVTPLPSTVRSHLMAERLFFGHKVAKKN